MFTDLHSHVLPAIDDGARALADSLAMLDLLRQLGFSVVHATPHQKVGFFVPTREAIDQAHRAVTAAQSADGPVLRLGAENMWDELFLERSQSQKIPGYRDPIVESETPKAFLFELPVALLPPKIEERLFAIRRNGPLPVMAHPERYTGLWNDRPRYERLGQHAALMVDLAALDGAHGAKECKTARWLVEEGLAHAAASDLHQPADARAVASGIAWIRKRKGDTAVTQLLGDGPRQILNGELPI